jgi:hypothetical protein
MACATDAGGPSPPRPRSPYSRKADREGAAAVASASAMRSRRHELRCLELGRALTDARAPPHPDALRVESSGKDFGERPEATAGARAYRRPITDKATSGRKDKLTVELELEFGREPVTGRLRTAGIEERFVGWLGSSTP